MQCSAFLIINILIHRSNMLNSLTIVDFSIFQRMEALVYSNFVPKNNQCLGIRTFSKSYCLIAFILIVMILQRTFTDRLESCNHCLNFCVIIWITTFLRTRS